MQKKVMVLGLDGATWKVLDKLREEYLPTFKYLCKNGIKEVLWSTLPPITAPAWLSIATGQHPGNTGVFYFYYREDKSLNFKPVGSHLFVSKSIWDYLSQEGLKCIVFNYPMLYPPYKINGIMISGLMSPEDNTITYPKELFKEINKIANGYKIRVPWSMPRYKKNVYLLINELETILKQHFEVFLYLLKKYEWDFSFGVISVTDWLQHYFFRFIDKEHVLYSDKDNELYYPLFIKMWKLIDKYLEKILELFPDLDLFLISDHGFGVCDQVFYINNYFLNKGYCHRITKKSFLEFAYKMGKKVASFFPMSEKFLRNVYKKMPDPIKFEINLHKSYAFALRQNLTSGMVYLNKNYKDFAKIKEEIIFELENIKEINGISINIKCYEPDKIYKGKKIGLAPDIIVVVNNFRSDVDPRFERNKLFIFKDENYIDSGGHRLDGMFLYFGSDRKLKLDKKNKINLWDIAPTILEIFGFKPPQEMDGENIFMQDLQLKELNKRDRYNLEERSDTEEIAKRLKELGYL